MPVNSLPGAGHAVGVPCPTHAATWRRPAAFWEHLPELENTSNLIHKDGGNLLLTRGTGMSRGGESNVYCPCRPAEVQKDRACDSERARSGPWRLHQNHLQRLHKDLSLSKRPSRRAPKPRIEETKRERVRSCKAFLVMVHPTTP